MKNLIGRTISIEYFDQNNDFESIFPRTGRILSRHITDNANDWYLIDLDEPFKYNGRNNNQLLIRSRWEGETLKNTSVFVLLIPDQELVKNEIINIDEFEHVAWGSTKLC